MQKTHGLFLKNKLSRSDSDLITKLNKKSGPRKLVRLCGAKKDRDPHNINNITKAIPAINKSSNNVT